jgi:hypothetical protein
MIAAGRNGTPLRRAGGMALIGIFRAGAAGFGWMDNRFGYAN